MDSLCIQRNPCAVIGFSPFELTFRRNVEGPLSLVKSTWLSDQPNLYKAKPNVVKLILDLRENSALVKN